MGVFTLADAERRLAGGKTVSEKALGLAIAGSVAEWDADLSPGTVDHLAASFLLASAVIGCNPDHIARLLRADKSAIHTFAYRARRNGIWVGDTCQSKPWMEEELGGVAFCMDMSIITGVMKRVGPDLFSMTARGKRDVERLFLTPKGPAHE